MNILLNENEKDFFYRNVQKLSSKKLHHKEIAITRDVIRKLKTMTEDGVIDINEWQLNFMLTIAKASYKVLEERILPAYKKRGDALYQTQTEEKIAMLKQTIEKFSARQEN